MIEIESIGGAVITYHQIEVTITVDITPIERNCRRPLGQDRGWGGLKWRRGRFRYAVHQGDYARFSAQHPTRRQGWVQWVIISIIQYPVTIPIATRDRKWTFGLPPITGGDVIAAERMVTYAEG